MVGLLALSASAVRHPARFSRVPIVVIEGLLPTTETTLLPGEEQRTLYGGQFGDKSSQMLCCSQGLKAKQPTLGVLNRALTHETGRGDGRTTADGRKTGDDDVVGGESA